ncbi:PREDICTED: uncharacterized protein LOC106821109 isoform X2 [Priapulus caudatus]|uniref:Uncharacterized protein LOC106821109 isoform X2 n=1 Tax=Priapulus caudatus TaxID=37621 RepID=A0ABM1FA08_PRICU|nr:PREDICTED: uncharacterized protein LOC106821109 isoform X2 [Priapulus caudatus]
MADHRRRVSSHSSKIAKNRNSSTDSNTQNAFRNDGSFMELFRKKMEEEERKKKLLVLDLQAQVSDVKECTSSPTVATTTMSTSAAKQRAVVDKELSDSGSCTEDSSNSCIEATNHNKISSSSHDRSETNPVAVESSSQATVPVKKPSLLSYVPKEPWERYLHEVRKYKSQMCTDEDQTRPLVK